MIFAVFPLRHTALRSKSKDWLDRNHDNFSECKNCSFGVKQQSLTHYIRYWLASLVFSVQFSLKMIIDFWFYTWKDIAKKIELIDISILCRYQLEMSTLSTNDLYSVCVNWYLPNNLSYFTRNQLAYCSLRVDSSLKCHGVLQFSIIYVPERYTEQWFN